MNKHRRDCVALCAGAGLTVLGVEQRGRHWAVVCAEGRVIMPSTPSDFRWRRNARAFARRLVEDGLKVYPGNYRIVNIQGALLAHAISGVKTFDRYGQPSSFEEAAGGDQARNELEQSTNANLIGAAAQGLQQEINSLNSHHLAARAAELDDSDPWAHLALGYVALSKRRTDEAVEEFQRTLDLNPNFAAAHGYLAMALALDGRSEKAIEHAEQAIHMSPHDPQNAIFNMTIAVAHYFAGRYPDAVAFGRKAIQQRTQFTSGHRIYIASLAQAGQIDEARAALAKLQELQPENSIAWIERNIPYTPGPMAKFLEGRRKAGLK